MSRLIRDDLNNPIQGFSPNPANSIIPVVLGTAQTYILARSGGDYTINDRSIVRIFTTGPIYRYFNTNSDATYPVLDEVTLVVHPDVDSITLVNEEASNATIYVEMT